MIYDEKALERVAVETAKFIMSLYWEDCFHEALLLTQDPKKLLERVTQYVQTKTALTNHEG